jgi:hypothetical protein
MSDTLTGFAADAHVPIQSWPVSVKPSQLSLTLIPNSTTVTSPFTGAPQSEARPGTCWRVDESFTSLDVDHARLARATVAQLRGSSGRLYLQAEPGRGVIAPQPVAGNLVGVVDAGPRVAGTAGGLLQTMGWSQAEGELIYRAGDYLSVDDAKGSRHLFMLLDDAVVGVDGASELVVTPELGGVELPAGAGIHHGGNASGVFYLVDDGQGQIAEAPGGDYSLSFSAIEFRFADVLRRPA